MLTLAQAAPAGTVQFLEVAFYLLGGIAAVVGLGKMLKKPEPAETEIGGQPIKVKFAAQFATKEEHENLRHDFGEFRKEVSDSFSSAAETSRQSREKIYIEQRRQAELLAANIKESELSRHSIALLGQKIDRMLERAAKK